MRRALAIAAPIAVVVVVLPAPAGALLVPPTPDDALLEADPEAAADLSAEDAPPPGAPRPPGPGPSGEDPAGPGPSSVAPPAAELAAPPVGDPAAVEAVLAEIRAAEGSTAPDLLGGLVGWRAGGVPPGHHELLPPASGDPLLASWARAANAVGVWAAAVVGWLVDAVLGFDVGGLLVDDAGVLSGRYADLLRDGEVPLRSLALLLAVAHAGWQVLRHRPHAAGPELLVALAIAATGSYLLARPDDGACRGLDAVRVLSTGAAALVLDPGGGPPPSGPSTACGQIGTAADVRSTGAGGAAGSRAPRSAPDDADAVGAPAAGRLVAEPFLTEPHLLLQWGAVPAAGTPCRAVADALLARRAWVDGTEPRRWMADAGCEPLAEASADLPPSRAVAAVAYAGAAVAFAVAVGSVAGAVLVAQVGAALLALLLPIAVVAGIAPGAGRRLLRTWAAGAVRCGVLALAGGFVLAVLLTVVAAVQAGTEGQGVLLRTGGSTAVAWAIVLANRWALRRGGRPAWRFRPPAPHAAGAGVRRPAAPRTT